MENYEGIKLDSPVTGIKTNDNKMIEGKFRGFNLFDKLNPKSVVGLISTKDGICYNVVPDSIKLVESNDDKIWKLLNEYVKSDDCILKFGVNAQIDMYLWLSKHKSLNFSKRDQELLNYAISLTDDEEVKNFLRSLRPNLNSEWTDKDEEMKDFLIAVLKVNHPNGHFKKGDVGCIEGSISVNEIIDWIKSLKYKIGKTCSQDDNNMINIIIDTIRCYYVERKGHPYVADPDSIEMRIYNFLNSLKSRLH